MAYYGPEFLRHSQKAALLNSRQSKYPVGNDPWIKATIEAVKAVGDRNLTLLTSLGMNTWELPLALASQYDIPTIIVIPQDRAENRIIVPKTLNRFRLNREKAGFLFIDSTRSKGRKKSWPDRDLKIVDMADIIYPISIRPGGSLGELLMDNSAKVKYDFTITYLKTVRHRPKYDHRTVNSIIRDGQFIVHLTRSIGSPWPGETEYDYYQAIVNSKNEYCHSARKTLLQILYNRKIIASGKNIRGGFEVVGLTALKTDNLKTLFRYRPRLVNPNFEPYGIGLSMSAAARYGIRPVIYGPPELYPTLTEADRPFYQNSGSNGGQWLSENEWRNHGDFCFDRIERSDIRIFVPDSGEVAHFRDCSDIPVLPLFDEPEAEPRILEI
jgi:hypothetical protein